MILLLIQYLNNLGIHTPAVFEYTSTRMMLGALTSLIFCIFVGPTFIRKLYELKIGQTIRTDECPLLGHLHSKKKDTPTMGGILILSGMLLSLILWMDFTIAFTSLLLFVTLSLGFLGGRDDYLKLKYKNTKGLSAKKKLMFQALVGLVIALYLLVPSISEYLGIDIPIVKADGNLINMHEFALRLYFPFFKDPILIMSGMAMLLFILFVIVGSSNAVNLTDGLDGLAGGCLLMVSSTLSLVAFLSNNQDIARYLNIPYIEGSGEIAVYLASCAGACLGFLWYNGHPAQVFMGDIGSLTMGGVIGASVVLLKREMLLGVVGGVFVAEAMSVILQVGSYKLRNKKRIFLIAPLHHHYEYKGMSETKVVMRFWIISLILAIIGVASLKFQ